MGMIRSLTGFYLFLGLARDFRGRHDNIPRQMIAQFGWIATLQLFGGIWIFLRKTRCYKFFCTSSIFIQSNSKRRYA